MEQEILQMIEVQSEHGHRTVSMILSFYGPIGGQELARHTGPDGGVTSSMITVIPSGRMILVVIITEASSVIINP